MVTIIGRKIRIKCQSVMTSNAFSTKVIRRDPPNAVVYDLSQANQVTITLPSGSTWSSGLHWHEKHVEYLRVVQGTVRVRLGNTVQTVTASRSEDSSQEIRVAKNVWHEWCRAEPGGEDVIVVERTDPEDGEKAAFFWNLNGVILKAQRSNKPTAIPGVIFGLIMDFWVTLNLFVIFRNLDNIPVFVNLAEMISQRGVAVAEGSLRQELLKKIDWFWSHTVLEIASILGWALGVHPVREDFTPAEVIHRWSSKNAPAQKLS